MQLERKRKQLKQTGKALAMSSSITFFTASISQLGLVTTFGATMKHYK